MELSALLLLALLLAQAGCHRGTRGGAPPPPEPEAAAGDNTAPVAVPEWLPPALATEDAEEVAEVADASSPDGHGGPIAEAGREATRRIDDGHGRPSVGAGRDAPGFEPPTGHGWPSAGGGKDAPRISDPSAAPDVAPDGSGEQAGASPADNAAIGAAPADGPPADGNGRPGISDPSAGTGPGKASRTEAGTSGGTPKPAAAPRTVTTAAPKDPRGASLPEWAKRPEELVYRVEFLGITMGYARFRYQGKVLVAGKPAYHLNVRAWTSGILSFIYPINDTIDYYLEAETLAPIRLEFTRREKAKDDVALYNQETGRITYRYRESGKIRKQFDTVPPIYDPVSVAYYFRWRDLGAEDRPRNVYGGRKVYQISSRILGNERIRTEHGEVDAIAVVPLIRRDGKPDNKGDLKIWFSGDERRVPVRLYAKFRKIKEWTLVGVLTSSTALAGG
jgi:hypothetical protein